MTRPIIGFDASRCFHPAPTGTENYAYHILRHLVSLKEAAAYSWRLYVSAPPAPLPWLQQDHVSVCVLPPRRMWTHRALAQEVRRHPPAVLFVPAHVLPFTWRPSSLPPAVMTIHDLGYEYFPEAHGLRQRLYLRLTTRYAVARAQRLICISAASARDLTCLYGADARRLDVVHEGCPPMSHPDAATVSRHLAVLGVSRSYALFLSTLQPRKNVARLIRSYTRLWRRHDLDWDLVLAGKPGWLSQSILEAAHASAARACIHLPGYVNSEQAGALYAGARFFCYPSLHEGFGLPVLEAQSCGVPVMTSHHSSLPEIAGDAALLVDPEDEEEIAQAMLRLSQDERLRQDLVEKGYRNLSRFSWEKAARETLAVLAKVMQDKP